MNSWFTIMAEEEHRETTRLLRMTAAEWRDEGKRIIRAWRGRDIRDGLAYLHRIETARAAARGQGVTTDTAPETTRTEFEVDFEAWRDMADEPWKYGEDITEWLALDAKLTSGPGRWRVGAYWFHRQAAVDARQAELNGPWRALYARVAKEAAVAGERAWVRRDIKRHTARFRKEAAERTARRAAAATRIAAAVRGHQTRLLSPYLNCCMCLSNRICPLQTPDGMMCRACGEQGPYEETTGPLPDPWNWSRASFVDLARKG